MTDKVQKIREEVVGIINSINLFTPDDDGKNSSYEAGKLDVASKILQIIDSMQEEPKECMYSKDNFTDEDRKVLCDGCEEECKMGIKSKHATGKLKECIDNITEESLTKARKLLQEEPVSEDLEEAAKHYLYSNILYDDVYVGNPTDKDCIEMFKAGAQWKEQQLVAKAVKVKISNASIVSLPSDCNLKVGDKVLIIRED